MVIVRTAAMPVTIALSGRVGSVVIVEVEGVGKVHARSGAGTNSITRRRFPVQNEHSDKKYRGQL
jgi:hypothetical protein